MMNISGCLAAMLYADHTDLNAINNDSESTREIVRNEELNAKHLVHYLENGRH